MKIGLLHFSFWPVIGGVETVVREHAALFCERGHEVTVFCGKGDFPPQPAESGIGEPPGAPVHPLRVVRFPVDGDGTASADRQAPSSDGWTSSFDARRAQLLDFLRSHFAGHDILFLHNVCTMPFDLALTAALWELADVLEGTRFICWAHDLAAANPDYTFPDPGCTTPWDRLRRAHPRMEYVAVSALRKQQLLDIFSLPPERCRVIPNGIDPVELLQLAPEVRRLAADLRLLERDLVLFHPARLLRRKNLETSLRVTAALRASGCDAVLLMTGPSDPHNDASSAYAALMRELRAELRLEAGAVFVNERMSIGPHEMASLYAVADALFFPSLQEGFGLPVLEAAIHHLPAFCADIDPLNGLPGAVSFPLRWPPEKIAAFLLRQISASASIQARKAALRDYAWPAVWRIFLAPLLAIPETANHP